ncbi:hypothetical protein [Nitrososphaeria virus YSH_462411]|uniref:Uncharacterized protein n=1 Tax=Nitrososphaeria virus YSH_462411 TaxID=3071321 RepID=A0A976UAG3_9CAUD|nr:hypothetical protein QKV92_gp23 [Yangshan Harbor Nitrososphaeria virus]UVF62295.1 hypothetical protein [Nitrososphaeria virus YSH_462411]
MNILQAKMKHPTKGEMEIGRWSKKDLALIIYQLTRDNQRIVSMYNDYHLKYGFHVG